jgi:hypothetical protein
MSAPINLNLQSSGSTVIDGGGVTTFGNVYNTNASSVTIQNSDTFNAIVINKNSSTLTFVTGKTPTISYFTAIGILGSPITINSGTSGRQANVTVSNSPVLDYVNIKDINAVTTTWLARDAVNNGNNNNIFFINGQFFAFF